MTTDSVSPSLLRSIPLFRGLNDTECRQLAEIAHTQTAHAAEVIVPQGASSQNLWVVLEGACEVVRKIAAHGHESELVLAEIGQHKHFGEMSFFHPAPHSADVRAKSEVSLLRLPHGEFQDLVDDGVAAAYKLSHNVIELMAERLRRMDDWVVELMTRECPDAIRPEWSNFREKLFTGWQR